MNSILLPIKSFTRSILKRMNVGILSYSYLQKLIEDSKKLQENSYNNDDIEVLLTLPEENVLQLLKLIRKSRSQYRQDLFVLSELNYKNHGYFVEFGATNGVDISNTFLLEKEFGWDGILAEPARYWRKDLTENRKANIETKCVWSKSNEILKFKEANCTELSTIELYAQSDMHKKARSNGIEYNVPTISLNDLLEKYNAPRVIDYLSIDTEGSEFEILSCLDFDKYSFRVITCEHNFTPAREKIYDLLSEHGYLRKYENLSKVDDWYVKH